MTPITKHTFELGKAIVELHTAATRLTVIANESKFATKKLMTDMSRSVEHSINLFKRAMPNKDYLKIFQDQLLNDEITLQVEAVKDMFIALPQGIRDEVEIYLEARFNLYAKQIPGQLKTQ